MEHTVLVVDDEKANRQTLERILVREKLRVVHAADGRQALERVHSHSVADTFERAPHLERVRAAYLALRDDPLVRILDATRPPVAVAADVWALVSEAMA